MQFKKGDNYSACSDPMTESAHRDYKHGHFYNGNITTSVKESAKEGSKGLAIDQGFIRTSSIPVIDESGDMGQDNKTRLKEQGSHAHFGYTGPKPSREI